MCRVLSNPSILSTYTNNALQDLGVLTTSSPARAAAAESADVAVSNPVHEVHDIVTMLMWMWAHPTSLAGWYGLGSSYELKK